MTALTNMIRIHRWILDEKQQRLAEIQRFAERMHEDLRRLEDHMEAEQAAAKTSFEGTVAYATFYSAALERRRRLQATIENLDRQVEAARDEVQAAFEELKKFELARNRLDKQEAERRQRLEQLTLDEVGANLYRRNRTADGSEGA